MLGSSGRDRVPSPTRRDPEPRSAGSPTASHCWATEALLRAHLFVLPTQGETFGVAIAEALGHGLPVVTSGQGGHRAFLPPAASRAVDARSGPALAGAIAELAADPERWTPEQIAAYARETFSEERRRADYREVYDRAVQRASKRQR
jgi:glycosyltransferase involved in cell wall biosynthesis